MTLVFLASLSSWYKEVAIVNLNAAWMQAILLNSAALPYDPQTHGLEVKVVAY
jgi:hypothetical protein